MDGSGSSNSVSRNSTWSGTRRAFEIVVGGLTTIAGFALGLTVITLKLIELGTEQGWSFYWSPNLALNVAQIPPDQWPHVWVILIEGVAAAAAISLAFNYTVHNVTQKIRTVHKQLIPLKLPADLVHVEKETRDWLDQLDEKDSVEKQGTIERQRQEIARLHQAHSDFERKVADLNARAQALEAQLRADENLFKRFDEFAEDIDKFATDIKKAAEQMRRERPRPA